MKNWIFYVSGGILIIAIMYYFYKKNKKKPADENDKHEITKDKLGLSFFVGKYAYWVFLCITFGYIIFYTFYSLVPELNESLKEQEDLIKYFSQISILFFTAGIFSASLKYLQFLGVFETEFNKVIMSKQFDKKLEKQLKQITFSKKFLLAQSNLQDIWENVTLCMYKQQFPELSDKIKKKIKNEFYLNKNISHYYKNFNSKFDIILDGDSHVNIEQKSSYTLIRPNDRRFYWDFKVSHLDEVGNSAELDFKIVNGTVKNVKDRTNRSEKKNGKVEEIVSCYLEGKNEYHIERTLKVRQNIDTDREFSFSSDRIIDDMSFSIEHCEKLGVYVSETNGTKFYPDGTYKGDDKAYINRDVFLPGEKFKIFIFRKT